MARVLSIGTAIPKGLLRQEDACAQAIFYNSSNAGEDRILQKLYRRTQIETRATIFCQTSNKVSGSLQKSSGALASFYPRPRTADDGTAIDRTAQNGASGAGQPGTEARMARYREEITPLAQEAVEKALAKTGMPVDCIENLVTVSCTGFFAPAWILKSLKIWACLAMSVAPMWALWAAMEQ